MKYINVRVKWQIQEACRLIDSEIKKRKLPIVFCLDDGFYLLNNPNKFYLIGCWKYKKDCRVPVHFKICFEWKLKGFFDEKYLRIYRITGGYGSSKIKYIRPQLEEAMQSITDYYNQTMKGILKTYETNTGKR